MPASYPRRRKLSSRPFILSTLIITLITTYALFLRGSVAGSQNASPLLRSRSAEPECSEVHGAQDQCAFVLEHCHDDEAGLLPYLTLYYCTLGNARPVAFVIMTVWLGLLFTTIGIAASDFFSVNLSTIASILGLSESLAGVTFLAFGNGSPDVFSTFAAMGSNSGSMAVGELIGAAGFITAVVAGSMALVREFKVSKKSFVRDICFFIVAVSFSMIFLADSELHLWECCVMIGFYVFYVIIVVGWHWVSTRRRRRRRREDASRGHFYGPTGHETDELEPYRDEEEDEGDTAPVGRQSSGLETADISALERASLLEPDTEDSQALGDDEDERERHVAAEMTSSMRATRPRWGRSNTTITPIRPSLVGALEFRSVLASLQKARNMRLAPLSGRSYSDHRSVDEPPVSSEPTGLFPPDINPFDARSRALSSGNAPRNLDNAALSRPDLLLQPATPSPHPSPGAVSIDGRLSPPPDLHRAEHPRLQTQSPRPSHGLQLQIPSPSGGSSVVSSGQSSPALSPFPALSESPMPMTPTPSGHPHSAFMLPHSSIRLRSSIPGLSLDDYDESPKPVKWWPYKFLPAPHVLWQTLFPTLQGWREKTIWDRTVSVISVPSIFLLVTTLPVVETDNYQDDSDDAVVNPPEIIVSGNPVPVSVEQNAAIEPETEWQEYRRSTMSHASYSSVQTSPALVPVRPQNEAEPLVPDVDARAGMSGHQRAKIPPSLEAGRSVSSAEEPSGWNRWLVALQIFTGPFFVIFIVWANMREEIGQPGRALFRSILYSLLVSLVLLALLLTTSPHKKPKYHFLLCFLGFVISIAWISTVAGEVVGVLKAFGVILSISEAILGLTIFAVGNSLGDLVADVTVARLGYPVMAL